MALGSDLVQTSVDDTQGVKRRCADLIHTAADAPATSGQLVYFDATEARYCAMRFAELQTHHSAHRSRDRTEGYRLARRTA